MHIYVIDVFTYTNLLYTHTHAHTCASAWPLREGIFARKCTVAVGSASHCPPKKMTPSHVAAAIPPVLIHNMKRDYM